MEGGQLQLQRVSGKTLLGQVQSERPLAGLAGRITDSLDQGTRAEENENGPFTHYSSLHGNSINIID